jgi:hypothetical protein
VTVTDVTYLSIPFILAGGARVYHPASIRPCALHWIPPYIVVDHLTFETPRLSGANARFLDKRPKCAMGVGSKENCLRADCERLTCLNPMGYNFEKFACPGGSYAPKISVRSNGALGFSQGALRRFGLWDGDWFIQLYFDRVNRVIGIEPTNAEGPGRARLTKKIIDGKDGRQSVNAFLSAKSFFDFYVIDYSETQSYLAAWDDEQKMIIVNLPNDKPSATNAPAQNEGGTQT